MDQFLQHLLNATMLGGTYALLGIGLTLIFGIMRVVNFTHGELYTFGAYMLFMFVMSLGTNFFYAYTNDAKLNVSEFAGDTQQILRVLSTLAPTLSLGFSPPCQSSIRRS